MLRLDLLHASTSERLLEMRAVALPVEVERTLAHLVGGDETLEHPRVLVPDLGEGDPRWRDELTRVRLCALPFTFLLRLGQRAVEDLRTLDSVDAPEEEEPSRVWVVASPKNSRRDALALAAL